MDKMNVRYSPDEAELIAAVLNRAVIDAQSADEVRQLAEHAARLNHLAARARKRAAQTDAA